MTTTTRYFRYIQCNRCGELVRTSAKEISTVLCKHCRHDKNYAPAFDGASGCTDCVWLSTCRVLVWTLAPLPCEPDSGITVKAVKSSAWVMPLVEMGVG
jgi:hypothetical protein